MAYRTDKGLEFLGTVSSEDLTPLYDCLAGNAPFQSRFTSELAGMREVKQHYPDHKKYWQCIAEELQKSGGNTFLNIFNGRGVVYKDILLDIAKKCQCTHRNCDDVLSLEKDIVTGILDIVISTSSAEELREFNIPIDLPYENLPSVRIIKVMHTVNWQMILMKLFVQEAFAPTTKLPNFDMLGLGLAVDSTTGPAYRVTLPCVLYISYLRKKYAPC